MATARLTSIVLAVTLAGCGGESSGPDPLADVGRAGDGRLATVLESIRVETGLPALAAVLVAGGNVLEVEAVGRRAVGFPEPVTTTDRWHLGSLTKSMTATLAAVLVERGVVRWETTVGEVFPQLIAAMHPQYAVATLDELLYHRTGMPPSVSRAPSWNSLRTDPSPIIEQRRRLAAELLEIPPLAVPGVYLYTNAGYIVAGAMLEALTGTSWEELLRREVFAPLGMGASGFGAPGSAGVRDAPWGHAPRSSGWQAFTPGPDADNPQALGPAGTVHATLQDYARYMAHHLAGARGGRGLVSAAMFDKLHTAAPATDYALGWGVSQRSWAGGRVLQHAGSNTLWYALVAIAPQRDFAVLTVTNAGGETAERGTDLALQSLIRRFDAASGR